MIRVVLPAHLRTLARVTGEVHLEVGGPATQRTVLDALEARYPMLGGTLRDHVTGERRPFVRFFACARGADVLAWKAASHHVNNSSPRPSVKCANIIPDRKRREGSVVLSSHKDGLGIWLAFDCADASMSEQLAGKDASTSAREKM